jgi:hypothetical protein
LQGCLRVGMQPIASATIEKGYRPVIVGDD